MYKIYESDNYIIVTNLKNNETFYGHRKEVFIDKSNVNKPEYSIFKVKDLKDGTVVKIGAIQKQDDSLYTEEEFDTFYRTNTGNFNGGGTAPTGDFIPLTGTTVGNPVSGDIIMSDAISIKPLLGSFESFYIGDIEKGAIQITDSEINGIQILGSINSKGLASSVDYTSNITDLDYPQKIYVDSVSSQTTTQRSTSTEGEETMRSGEKDLVLIHEAGTTTSLSVYFPSFPKNNQKVTIMSVGGIGLLTLITSSGSIIGTVTALTALASVKFIWLASENKWYRI
jgi:hypothetical protein